MTFEEKVHTYVTYHPLRCGACYCTECGYFYTSHYEAFKRGHDFHAGACSCGRDEFVKELLEMNR